MPPLADRLFVGIQVILLLGLAFDPGKFGFAPPTLILALAGLICLLAVGFGIVSLLQLGTSFTPWPSPRAGGRLVTEGLYGFARHPIYASLIWFAGGLGVATGSPWRLLLGLGLWLLFSQKAKYEEQQLRAKFPAYARYADQVSRFGRFPLRKARH